MNFLAPWGSNDYKIKVHFFHLLLNVKQMNGKYIVKMKKSVYSKIVKFMAPWTGVLVLGRASNENSNFLKYPPLFVGINPMN